MDKKGTVLVLGGTLDMAFAMGTFLVNLKNHGSGFIEEVVIFQDGKIKETDKKIIADLFPSRFITYTSPIKANGNNKFISYFSDFVFSKYEILRLLSEYNTVIWSDYDVVVLDDISEIAAPCRSGARMILTDHAAGGSFIVPPAECDVDGPRACRRP